VPALPKRILAQTHAGLLSRLQPRFILLIQIPFARANLPWLRVHLFFKGSRRPLRRLIIRDVTAIAAGGWGDEGSRTARGSVPPPANCRYSALREILPVPGLAFSFNSFNECFSSSKRTSARSLSLARAFPRRFYKCFVNVPLLQKNYFVGEVLHERLHRPSRSTKL
jgi:hypothetical protein